MGNTQTVDGKQTMTFDKDSGGNIKYNTSPINLPFVKQDQWADKDNYGFLDTKFAPLSGGGYIEKTGFDTTLNSSAPFIGLKSEVSLLGNKYTGMQDTYNTNFSTIANNLGMTTGSDGVVSGSTDSSTFVTTSTVKSTISDIISKMFPDQIELDVTCIGGSACNGETSKAFYKYMGDTLTVWGNANSGNFKLASTHNYVIRFPVQFANPDYSFVITPLHQTHNSDNSSLSTLAIFNKTKDSVGIHNYGPKTTGFSWIAVGKRV
jgi:hypothetical protein